MNQQLSQSLKTHSWQTVLCVLPWPVSGAELLTTLEEMKRLGTLGGNLNYIQADSSSGTSIQIGMGPNSFVLKDSGSPPGETDLSMNGILRVIALVHYSARLDPEDLFVQNIAGFDFQAQMKLMWEFGERLKAAVSRSQ